jgi:hypothetical protein
MALLFGAVSKATPGVCHVLRLLAGGGIANFQRSGRSCCLTCMMASLTTPAKPVSKRLSEAGIALWRSVTREFEFEPGVR